MLNTVNPSIPQSLPLAVAMGKLTQVATERGS